MSNVIGFLETMGSNAAMSRMSAGEYLAAVAALETDDEVRQALVARNSTTLGDALSSRPVMMCIIATPGDGEGEDAPQDAPVEDMPDSPDAPSQLGS